MNRSTETELGPDDIAIWLEIWNNLHETRYGAFYEEMCSEHSLKIWRRFDALFKILQFSTTSGSAIAGWSLWNKEGFRWLWAILAGLAVLISIIHGALTINDKIKEDTLEYSKFKSIRVQCERLISDMKIRAYERLSDYKRHYIDLRMEYAKASENKKPDFLMFRRTEEKIQTRLNKTLEIK